MIYLFTYIHVLNSSWKLFDRYEGFNVDLVQAISEILGFNYTMSEVSRTLVDWKIYHRILNKIYWWADRLLITKLEISVIECWTEYSGVQTTCWLLSLKYLSSKYREIQSSARKQHVRISCEISIKQQQRQHWSSPLWISLFANIQYFVLRVEDGK